VLAVATRAVKHRGDLLERAPLFPGQPARGAGMAIACCQFM